MQDNKAIILQNRMIAKGIFQLDLQIDPPKNVISGQFVNIAVPGLFLRRPISIYDYQNGVLSLIIQIVGQGSRILSQLKQGENLDVLWPLGNGFNVAKRAKKIWLVGGGVGVAPLKMAARVFQDRGAEVKCIIGFRGSDYAYAVDELNQLCSETVVMSDDGSIGLKGYVHQGLLQLLKQDTPDAVLCCGPSRMLAAIQTVMADYPHVPALASLEQRMGCGYGVCKVCVCKINKGQDFDYMRVCADGPVFQLSEVAWE